jgi:PAS domain S-box-containing protein
MLRTWASYVLKALVFLALYLATTTLLHGHTIFRGAVLWLPTGVAVAGLWLLGPRYWPVVALGTITHRLLIGYMFPSYLLPAAANALEALAAVALLRRFGFRADLGRLHDGLALVATAILAPMVSATLGQTNYFVWPGHALFLRDWMSWWRMNALGLLVATPLILSWSSPPRPSFRLRALLEALGVTATVIGAAWLLTSIDVARVEASMVLSYLALPVAIYAAVRFGVRGATTAAAGLVALLTLGTLHGLGPFVSSPALGTSSSAHQLALQAMIALVTTTPMLLGAVIAERGAAQARIALEREQHQEFLASLNCNVNEGLFRISLNRGLVYVNNALARMLGYATPADLLGVSHVQVFADPARAEELRSRVIEQGQLLSEEVQFRRRDGSPLPALVSCTIVRGTDGHVEHCDGAVSDITARKRLEEQLRQTQKMEALGKLAGGVAHDFNNLLTVIGGHAELLRASLPEGAKVRADADEITQATARAARLTSQLLAYSRRQVLEPEVLDLRAVVEQSITMLRRLISEDIQLVTRCGDDELLVRVDRGQIEQVILNLVLNARDAMPGGGTLLLEAAAPGPDDPRLRACARAELPPGPLVCLSVRDRGAGMSEEVLSQAFDPFFTTKELGKGTGLGLSTVYGIVRQSAGVVWLESAPGAGTTVRVCFPRVADREGEATDTVAPAAAGLRRGTVLVVEDEPGVRALLARTLQGAGYGVLVAEDGDQALEIARQTTTPIDLVVTDAIMPRMGGHELVARLAAEWPRLRVLLVSGYPPVMSDSANPRAAVMEYLPKPFTPSTLLQRVQTCLARERFGAL